MAQEGYTVIMKLKDFRSLPPEAQEDIRRKAVKAVLDGKSQTEAARLFGVSRQAVNIWMRLHDERGPHALKAKRRGRPTGGSLKPWQAAWVVRMITDRQPDQLKLPFFLWTREAVAQLIERRFGIGLSIWTVGRYLAKWGFTPQKPVRQAFEQNPEQGQRWLNEKYPAIRRQAKREHADIYWGDEMGVRSDHAAGRSFSRKGETPVIEGTGRRFGCNMISALTNRGHLAFMVFKQRFRVDVFLEFLRRLVRHTSRKVFLILDGHPVHRALKVKAWIQKYSQQIRVFFLPEYSPELNPDELLNPDVKSNAVGRRRAPNQEELIKNVRGYLRSTQRQPHIVKRYFQERHVRYAAL
jgi:transposase